MIKIDYTRDELFTEQGLTLVKDFYMTEGDKSPQDALARASEFFATDEAHAQRIYDAVSQQHFMFASPILSNANSGGKGMPISCFLSYVPDSIEGLISHEAEVDWLSILGGGVGGHWSSVRAVDKKSPGPIPFIHSVDAAITAYKQGQTRKGAYAAYLDVSHPDIAEFLQIRVPTGGDVNRKCFNIHNAVNISDDFMIAVMGDLMWDLKCPVRGDVKQIVRARELWESILTVRHRTGEPFLNFIDEANAHLHPAQKALGLKVHGSNLCNEIHLATNEERTAVCCLSSLNLEKYDDWKGSDLVGDLVEYLDNVLDHFIANAPDSVSRAKFAAMRSRDIGIGAMGWHGYLMKEGIAFESEEAVTRTDKMFQEVKAQAVLRNLTLGETRGACPDAKETGYTERNLHLLAIAPNANSSIICNCTASVEPVNSNAFAHRTRAGTHLVKNKFLEPILEENCPTMMLGILGKTKEGWLEEQWQSIIKNDGSVQHLSYLSDDQKLVFKTFKEIDMMAVIEQAGVRQKHLCQGQSINLFFEAEAERKYVNAVHLAAWRNNLKGLYYLRTGSIQKADKVSDEVVRAAVGDADECTQCHA